MATGDPVSPAGALHRLLSNVMALGSQTNSMSAWAEVLGEQFNTPAFAERHSQVVALLHSVTVQVMNLEDGPRERYSGYLHAWWNAVIQPTLHWGQSPRDTDQIIASHELDMLGALSDYLKYAVAGTSLQPIGVDLLDLRAVLQEWYDAIQADAGLAPQFRLDLLRSLHESLFLIDNVNLFGMGAAVQAANGTFATVAATTPSVDSPRYEAWMKAANRLFRAIVVITTGVDTASDALDAAQRLTRELTESAGDN